MNNQQPKIIITTTRLILRTWTDQDILPMSLISSDPKVMEYFPYTQGLEETRKFVQRITDHFRDYGYGLYAVEVKSSGQFIGFVGLNHPSFDIPNFIPNGMPIVEIGWRLSYTHWGVGYATEAAQAVLDHAFSELNLNEIISFTTVINDKSRRVMEKIGLHRDKNDDFDYPKVDEGSPLKKHVLYRLTRSAYFRSRDQK